MLNLHALALFGCHPRCIKRWEIKGHSLNCNACKCPGMDVASMKWAPAGLGTKIMRPIRGSNLALYGERHHQCTWYIFVK